MTRSSGAEESSAEVTAKAWDAYGKQDWDGAIAQADKAVSRWFSQAKEMNDKITDYAPKETAATYWAVNDVGTCLYIKGNALEKKNDKQGAIEAYTRLDRDLKYSQCWDVQGWFWKPAEAARRKLAELRTGAGPVPAPPQPGEESSAGVTAKAWDAYGKQDWDGAVALADRAINTWLKPAKEMNNKMAGCAPKDTAATFWALNDVGTCFYIKGSALLKKKDTKGAIEAFSRLTKELKYAQCWDTKGWFWKPAEAAKQQLMELQFQAE